MDKGNQQNPQWKEQGLTLLEKLMDWLDEARPQLRQEIPTEQSAELYKQIEKYYSDLGFNRT